MPKAKVRDGVFQRSDRAGWWISFIDSSGVRCKRKVEAHTRPQALAALAAAKTKVEKERVLGVKHKSDITTADLLARFKRHQRSRTSASTYERLDGILATLNKHLPALARDVSKKSISDLISTRSDEVAPGTIQKEIAVLKHALRLAVEWELLHENAAQGVKLPRLPEGRTRYLSPTELKSVLEAAPDWMRAPLALAAFTGMRRGEILSLKWSDVDLPNRRVYLHETKNGSLRVLALNGLALQVLKSLPAPVPSAQVFPGVDAKKLSVYTRRLFSDLGIEDASFHSLRHTAASWLVMQGVDLFAVGQILGHRTPKMTQRYAHLSPQYMAGAMGKLDSAFAKVLPRSSPSKGQLVPTESPRKRLKASNGLK
jgi:integrase